MGIVRFTKKSLIYACLAVVAVLFVMAYAYLRVFPFYFSGMDQINPDELTGEFDDRLTGEFHGQKVTSALVMDSDLAVVLGSNDGVKRIEVDLTAQKVYAYQGSEKMFEFTVSTGKWGRTPTGTFRIWGKNRYAKMSGGSRALHTYYYLPNVPYIMWFSGDGISAARGFSLHGTYWHDNFGHPMSHGCVNMHTADAEILYNWVDPPTGGKNSVKASKDSPGTEVVIYGVTPRE